MKNIVKQFGSSALMLALVIGLAYYCKTLTPAKPADDEQGKIFATVAIGAAIAFVALAAVDKAQQQESSDKPQH